MSIVIACGQCGKRYTVDAGLAGRRVKCKACGDAIEVPRAAAAPPGAPPRSTAAPTRPEATAARAASTARVAPPPAAPAPLPEPDDPFSEDPFADLESLERGGTPAPVPGRPAPMAAPPMSAPPPSVPPPGALAPMPPGGQLVLPIDYQERLRKAEQRRGMAVGADNATPWLVLIFVAVAIIDGIRTSLKASEFASDVSKLFGRTFKPRFDVIWTIQIADIVILLGVIGAGMLLAMFCASKIMKFELQPGSYFKCAGVAAIPSVVVGVLMMMPPNRVIAIIVLLGIIPLAYYVIKFAFDLTFAEAGVALGLAVPIWVGAQIVRVLLLMAIVSGFHGRGSADQFSPFAARRVPFWIAAGDEDRDRDREDEEETRPEPARPRPPIASGTPNTPSPTPPPPIPTANPSHLRLMSLQQTIENANRRDTSDMSREEGERALSSFRSQLASDRLRATPDDAGLIQSIEGQLADLQRRYAALPSEKPDPAIFQPAAGGEAWAPAAANLGEEVSFRTLRFRPPADALVNLQGSENDNSGLMWTSRENGHGRIVLRMTPKTTPKQQRPWVATKQYMLSAASRERLYAIDAQRATVTQGTINGMPFWRVVQDAPAGIGSQTVQYIAPVGDEWLIAEVRPGNVARSGETLEASLRTLRPQKPGEARADPFSIERVAPRLADDATNALAILRKHGAAAEPAVLAVLTGTDTSAAAHAAKFLTEFGTARSVPALTKAAESTDRDLSANARAAIKRIAPAEYDAAYELLLDIRGGDHFRKRDALRKLAEVQPTEKRRAEVATLLEDLVLGDGLGFEVESAGKALAVWHGEKTVQRLLPILADERGNMWKRNAVIDALAGTGDRAAAAAILRWLIKEPQRVVAAMSKMGPAAEDPVVKLYNSIATSRAAQDTTVRANCVRILSEAGATNASLQVLARAARDPRDVPTQAIATAGIESIKQRMAAKPATRPG